LLCAIETVAGLGCADAIAAADRHVAGLGFGGVDFAAELGVAPAWEPLLTARSGVVAAAAGAGVAAWDMPRLALDADADLAEECRRGRALGFRGKVAIHPAQVAVINREFSPSAAEVAEARAVIAAADGGRAARHGRNMVDAAVARRAQRVIDAAERSGA
jgi:citrate lyase beta subunit